jgi:hypothetical protein
LGIVVLGLAVVTVAMLLSRAARRFFAAPVGPAEPDATGE